MRHSVIVSGVGDGHSGKAGDGLPAMPRVPGLVILRRLGRGGHGEVWLAADLGSGERVAVKVRCRPADGRTGGDHPPSDPAGCAGDDEAARLAREIAVLRRIDHPHVVRLRRVVDLPDGDRALVMDLAAGGNLADLVAGRGSLEQPEVCTIIVPLAQTLAELHGRGLVHGDLSPSNVLFTADGRPMIADLGCAAVLGDRPTRGWGSDGYVDPGRTGLAAPADDVFALGALIRFALTGDPGAAEAGAAEAGGGAPGSDVRDDGGGGLDALADLCTNPDPARRPGPRDVARAVLAATPPAPVRLLRATGVTGPVRGGPRTAGPTAAGRGWTKPADRPAPTAATVLPGTAHDLGFDAVLAGSAQAIAGAGRTGSADSPGTRPSSSGPTAVTRRRTPPTTSPPRPPTGGDRDRRPAGGSGRPPGRPPQHQRLVGGRGRSLPTSTAAVSRRGMVLLAVAVMTATAGAWFLLGVFRPAAPSTVTDASRLRAMSTPRTSTPRTSAPQTSRSRGASIRSNGTGVDDVALTEPLDVAVARLARGRADAFGSATPQALSTVDEPGSVAMASDVGLVRRLTARGLRLEDLSFQVSGVRRLRSDGEAVTVAATVVTSAHRQVTMRDGVVRSAVPASPPRRVVLTLVPAPDGRRWLVRDAQADEPASSHGHQEVRDFWAGADHR